MTDLRELRRTADLSQRDFAELMGVPVNTFRMWDSGLRRVPMLRRAQELISCRAHQDELLPLDRLASELGVHLRTLQAAARTGRLDAQFSSKSVFGRPLRFATRAAGEKLMATHYRRFGGQQACPSPLVAVPNDYYEQLTSLRRRLRLTQDALAQRIGAAGKAVVYQWESRKRTPSPVFWERILRLEHGGASPASQRSTSGSTSPVPRGGTAAGCDGTGRSRVRDHAEVTTRKCERLLTLPG